MRKHIIFRLMLLLVLTGCSTGVISQPGNSDGAYDLKKEIRRTVGVYALDLPCWEIENFIEPVKETSDTSKLTLNPIVLRERIKTVLKDNNINVIPPINFRLAEPPHLLVISPRNKIEYFDRVLLSPDLNENENESIEGQVDKLNLSSLVVELGGFGAAYPAIVSPDMEMKQIINAAVEEWVHQYLAFRPLGFLYLIDSLGLSQNQDVITMNETLAGMMAEEIGNETYGRYYQDAGGSEASGRIKSFDFDKEMRETRRNADELLSQGKVNEAEQYMEVRRLLFIKNGYKIRKLNQAYFAVHGIYGHDPGSASPIYETLNKFRNTFSSLSGFVNEVSAMTSYADLEKALHKK